MQEVNFDEALAQILAKDARYHHDAYHFVREALDFTQKQATKDSKRPHHVTGQQPHQKSRGAAATFCCGFRAFLFGS